MLSVLFIELMVVFECSRCNETVKKPKMIKHLQSCRSEYVSCIDCSQRFRWDEWEAHTQCISEAQKYQGNLFQAKGSQNKGKAKQDNWTESIQKSIEEAGSKISPNTKMLLEKLLGFDNIPRKQKPFANFVKNSLKIWDEGKINEIWEVISAATKKAQAEKPQAAAPAPAPAAPSTRPRKDSFVDGDSSDEEAAAPVKATPAKAAPAKAEVRWAGWKRALDGELKAAGGELPWKRLRDATVKRYHDTCQENGLPEDQLGFQALAAIPEVYLNEKDELVRLPGDAPLLCRRTFGV